MMPLDPNKKLLTDRVRTTQATTQKSANIRRIIDALCIGEMTRQSISELLEFSPSGARKYVADLKRADIMRVVRQDGGTSWHPGHDVYRLNPDAEVVDAFLAKLDAGAVPVSVRDDRPAPPRTGLHICPDDMAFSVKAASFAIPAPDPLLAHLFGRAGAA